MPNQKGAGWGFDGSSIGGSAPIEVRSVTNDCAVPERVAPVQLGGRYRQEGGACGCNMLQGGRRKRGGRYQLSATQRGGRYSRRYSRRYQQSAGGCGSRYQQSGGGCGACMMAQSGGGGGGGGYSVVPSDNMLGKVAVIQPGSCMKGGDASPPVHTAGYDNTSAFLSDSSNFTLVTPYQAKGGRSKRNRSKGNRSKGNRSRRNRSNRRQSRRR